MKNSLGLHVKSRMHHMKTTEEVLKKSSKEHVILRKSKIWPKMAHHTRINCKPWVIILFTAVNQQCLVICLLNIRITVVGNQKYAYASRKCVRFMQV